MRRESFDALFSNFFSRDFFLSLILTKHRKNKKNNQFSIYLRNYLLFNETRRSFVDDDKNLNFKLLVDSDLHDSNVDIVVSFVIIVNFVIFIFFSFLFSSFFFFFAIFFVAFFFFFIFFFFFSTEFESNAIFDETRFWASTRDFFFAEERKSIVMTTRRRLSERAKTSYTFSSISRSIERFETSI